MTDNDLGPQPAYRHVADCHCVIERDGHVRTADRRCMTPAMRQLIDALVAANKAAAQRVPK